MTAMRPALFALLVLAGCAGPWNPLDDGLEAKTLRTERWVRVDDDGTTAILAPRSVRGEVASSWLSLMRDARRDVAEWFGEPLSGRLNVHLVDRFPEGFEADGFSNAERLFVRCNPDAAPKAADRDLIAHEIVHVFLAQRWKIKRPYWFEEGLATYIEGERLGYGVGGKSLLADVVGLDMVDPSTLRFDTLHTWPPRLSYRLAAVAVAAVLEKWGKARVLSLGTQTGSFEDAWALTFGETTKLLEERWRDAVRLEQRRRTGP